MNEGVFRTGGTILTGKNRSNGANSCLSVILSAINPTRNRTTAVRSQRMNARDTARPNAAQRSRMLLYSYCV